MFVNVSLLLIVIIQLQSCNSYNKAFIYLLFIYYLYKGNK